TWGTLTGVWVPHDTRDRIVDFIRRWSEKTEIGAGSFIGWLDITASKFYDWRERYGKVNEHNGWVPRDFWLEDWEKQAIIGFHLKNPLEGYRRLTFMMLGAEIVAVHHKKILDTVTPVAVCYVRNIAMANSLHSLLTRRERELMDAVFALGDRASAAENRARRT